MKFVENEVGYIDCVVKCKGYQEAKKSSKQVKEFDDKMKELKGLCVCWEA